MSDEMNEYKVQVPWFEIENVEDKYPLGKNLVGYLQVGSYGILFIVAKDEDEVRKLVPEAIEITLINFRLFIFSDEL